MMQLISPFFPLKLNSNQKISKNIKFSAPNDKPGDSSPPSPAPQPTVSGHAWESFERVNPSFETQDPLSLLLQAALQLNENSQGSNKPTLSQSGFWDVVLPTDSAMSGMGDQNNMAGAPKIQRNEMDTFKSERTKLTAGVESTYKPSSSDDKDGLLSESDSEDSIIGNFKQKKLPDRKAHESSSSGRTRRFVLI